MLSRQPGRHGRGLYVALTEFARRKVIRGGLPASKIAVKPNFVGTDHGAGDGAGNFGLFVGRLDSTKGLDVLLNAWSKVHGDFKLKVLGDGPLAPVVCEAALKDNRIEWLGRQPLNVVYDMMGQAAFLVVSSVWYEGLPRTLVESFSRGTPIIASKLGALEDLIRPGETGWHFEPNDASDLAMQITRAFASPEALRQMRGFARREYEAKYTADDNYRQMMTLYDRALRTRGDHGNHRIDAKSDAGPCDLTVRGNRVYRPPLAGRRGREAQAVSLPEAAVAT